MKKLLISAWLILSIALPISLDAAEKQQSWLILWYLCGSDLESQHGAATADIAEILEAKIPDNVKIVIQTGGSNQWQNEVVKSNKIGRYLVENGDITLLEELPDASMGDPSTLESFVKFGLDKYPTDRKMFIFWNHGAGSAGGVSFDERHDMDSLTLDEISQSFANLAAQNYPVKFDIMGFDACLMATLDTAVNLIDYGNYMVASQAVEPGLGWSYTDWLNTLSKNTNISSLDLSKAIVDSYSAGIENGGEGGTQTLSVINLQKIKPVFYYYNMLGLDYVKIYSKNHSVLTKYSKSVKNSEVFDNGMVDLTDVLKGLQNNIPSLADKTQNVLAALDDAIVYNKTGNYSNANGLSIFYPLEQEPEPGYNMSASAQLMQTTFDDTFKVFNYVRAGVLDSNDASRKYQQLEAFLNENESYFLTVAEEEQAPAPAEEPAPSEESNATEEEATEEEPTEEIAEEAPAEETAPAHSNGGNMLSLFQNAVDNLNAAPNGSNASGAIAGQLQNVFAGIEFTKSDLSSLANQPVDFDKEGDFAIKLTEKQMDLIDSVAFNLYFLAREDNLFIELGSDANLNADWDKGTFSAKFNGFWPCMDGHILKIDIEYIGEEFYRYNVPIKVNGVRADMSVVYDFKDEQYHIHSIKKHVASNIPERNTIKLKKGDKITTVLLASALDSDEDSKEVDVDTFTYNDETKIIDEDLGDGVFRLEFVFTGADGTKVTSNIVESEIKGEEINNSILED